MKLHAFHVGGEIAPWSMIDPFHPKVGQTFPVPFHAFLIEHDQGLVLFDLGAHPKLAHDPRARLGAAADDFDVRLTPEDHIIPQLAKLGVKPDDIAIVALTHLHYDHCGGIEFFPKARFLVQQTELRFAHWPGIYQRSIYVPADEPLRAAGRLQEIEGGLVLAPGVRIVPTPGHTPGHQSVWAYQHSESLLVTGDLLVHAVQLVDPGLAYANDMDPDQARETRRAILDDVRARGATLAVSHLGGEFH